MLPPLLMITIRNFINTKVFDGLTPNERTDVINIVMVAVKKIIIETLIETQVENSNDKETYPDDHKYFTLHVVLVTSVETLLRKQDFSEANKYNNCCDISETITNAIAVALKYYHDKQKGINAFPPNTQIKTGSSGGGNTNYRGPKGGWMNDSGYK